MSGISGVVVLKDSDSAVLVVPAAVLRTPESASDWTAGSGELQSVGAPGPQALASSARLVPVLEPATAEPAAKLRPRRRRRSSRPRRRPTPRRRGVDWTLYLLAGGAVLFLGFALAFTLAG